MQNRDFDVIIVGARIAGSTLAALLGRAGLRVMLADRTQFPSDTFSTHVIYGDSFAVWREAGCWSEIERIGAAPLDGIVWQRVTPETDIRAPFIPAQGFSYGLCLRRLLLDDILFRNAARTPGVAAMQQTRAVEVLWSEGRVTGVRYEQRTASGAQSGVARAPLVVGADGRFSFVARAVESLPYNVFEPRFFPYYAYLRDVEPVSPVALEIFDTAQPRGTIMLAPCDDGIWLAVLYTAQSEYDTYRLDHRRIFWERLTSDRRIAGRLSRASLASAVKGRGDMTNFMRVAAGNGWALVGDAGQFKDPINGQGIGDAARSARLFVDCVGDALHGNRPLGPALAEYQAFRDRDLIPNFEWMIKGKPRGLTREEFEELRANAGASDELALRFVNIFSHAISADEVLTDRS